MDTGLPVEAGRGHRKYRATQYAPGHQEVTDQQMFFPPPEERLTIPALIPQSEWVVGVEEEDQRLALAVLLAACMAREVEVVVLVRTLSSTPARAARAGTVAWK